MHWLRALSLSSASIAVLLSGSAQADTLRDALLKAYQSNPTLTGARAEQRANDENVPLALADGRPSLDVQGAYTENFIQPNSDFTSPTRQVYGSLNLSIPLYQGGGVKNNIRAAKARVAAGAENLRATESTVFRDTVAAYMNVIRDSAIVSLNAANVHVLEVNLNATRDRFEVGDLTRTDIAQSESRLALARSDLRAAEAQLVTSREQYIQLVGDAPDNLEAPAPLPNLPETPDTAVDVAIDRNADVAAARKLIDAARYDVSVARAQRLPQVALVANGGYTNFLGTVGSPVPGVSISQISKTASGGVQLTLPLYQGGRPAAQTRQAQAREGQAIEQATEIERAVVAQTRSAYASWQASQQVIQSSQVAVDAASLSLEGVRAENSVGTRTILDILNAEQELLNAQVQLVSARRDAYVAGFALLASMGLAEAEDLGLDGGPLYDPTTNYKRVHHKLWDWDDDRAPLPVATSTVDTPAQNAEVTPISNQ